MSPITVKTSLAVQIIEHALYLFLNCGALDVVPVDVIVTPAPCANDVKPTPMLWTLMMLPAAKTLGGIVTVTGEPFDVVTNLPRSAATSV